MGARLKLWTELKNEIQRRIHRASDEELATLLMRFPQLSKQIRTELSIREKENQT